MVAAAYLDKDILPSLIQYFLDMGRNFDDLFGGDHFVILVYISVIHLVKSKSVWHFSAFIYLDLCLMLDLALALK